MSGVVHGLLASLAGVVRDTFFRYVSLLLNTSATNGAQNNTFLDGSTNAFSITRNGNTTQGNFSPFSQTGWSNYFDGTGDWLNTSVSPATLSGDFTLEGWVYITSLAANRPIACIGDDFQSTGLTFFVNTSNRLGLFGNNASILTGTTETVALNAWNHVACVRSSGTIRVYLNGNADSTTASNSTSFSGAIQIGRELYNTATGILMLGYISNLRLVTSAVYTANFTPPTSPLTAISGTSLLTCQSNRFIDNSSNAFAITRNGDVSVQAFSPFAPTAAWSASTNGGSGYFDGNGDELNAGSNAAFSFGTGAYTVEAWVYLTAAVSATHQPCFVFNDTTNGFGFWNENGGNQLNIGIRGVATALASTTTLAPNIWNHIVAVRSGTGANQTAIFVNGTRVANGTDANNWTITGPLKIGGITIANFYLNGYASNVRVVKGTAVYDPTLTTLTVPTAPLTAIANTSLLLNFTNAGIYDSASGNDLETVGNAQVSTVQAKWGTTSISCDGTGDYVVAPSTVRYGYGTGDFTIEFWLYLNTAAADQTLVSNLTSVSSTNPHIYLNGATGTIRYYTASADRITGSALSAGQWYHIAVSRASSNTRMFINGTQTGSTYADANNYGATAPIGVGTYWSAGSPVGTSTLNGYIDDLRITNGIARYTSNFTAPTAAFPLQ